MDSVCIPSVWISGEETKSPSKVSWASFDEETGEYEHGEKYYDEDMNEITKDEYGRLTKNPGN